MSEGDRSAGDKAGGRQGRSSDHNTPSRMCGSPATASLLASQWFNIPMAHTLDQTDWRILRELMADGAITNVALAARVGLSPPPCLRRVRALEEQGLITGYTALVDEKLAGFELTAFAMVGLHSQSETDLRAFENRVLGWPCVREAYMLSGESDYILKCVARDLGSFQDFILHTLTAAPNVASVKTNFAIRRAKLAPGVPVTGGEG